MNENKLYEDACKLAMYRSLENVKDYKEAIKEIYQELVKREKGEYNEGKEDTLSF